MGYALLTERTTMQQIVIEERIQSYQDLIVIYGSDSSVETVKRRINLLAKAYNLTCKRVSDYIA